MVLLRRLVREDGSHIMHGGVHLLLGSLLMHAKISIGAGWINGAVIG
jgi:hypothetical protein